MKETSILYGNEILRKHSYKTERTNTLSILYNITHLTPMKGEAINFHTSLAHNVLHDEYLGDIDDIKMSHAVLAV